MKTASKITIKVPKQIQVGGHSYKVLYKSHLSKDDDIRGCIRHRQQEIWIEPENPLSQKNATILHEIMHFANVIFSIDLTESAIDRIAEGLFQVLSDSFEIEFDWSDISEEDENSTRN